MNHNKKNIISALVFSMLSIIAYLITYNNKVLFFLVFVCERLYSFGAKEELEKIQTMAEVINLAEENDFEELYLSYMDF